jgi:hypothetical protein
LHHPGHPGPDTCPRPAAALDEQAIEESETTLIGDDPSALVARVDKSLAFMVPWLCAALVTSLALAPLFHLDAIFYVDWINHLWSVEYFGEYWKQHHQLPAVFNTQQVIGIDVPIFYAYHFYAVAGILSSAVGSGLAIRSLAFAALALQFVVVSRSLAAVGAERTTGYTVAALLGWGIYSLTNLYNRSALTEFFAITLLTCSLSSLLSLLLRIHREPVGAPSWLQPGFFYALAAVTHPLTAAFGALLVIALGVTALAFTRSWRLLLFGVASAGAILVVLSPWLLAYRLFGGLLPVNDATFARKAFQIIGYFPGSLDAPWSRFSLVPLDGRSLLDGTRGVSTPYLDAQVSVPLLLALAARLFDLRRNYKRLSALQWALACVALACGAYFSALSVRPAISEQLGGVFNILQFAYRLTAYINLTALAAFMALSGAASPGEANRPVGLRATWLSFCLALALSGLVTKLYHASAIEQTASAASVSRLASELQLPVYEKQYPVWFPGMEAAGQNSIDLPPTYYGHPVFSMLGAYGSAPEDAPRLYAAMEPETGGRFGHVRPLELFLQAPSLLVTNVQPFPWNRLIVDGSMRAEESLLIVPPKSTLDPYRRFDGLAVKLDAGRHVVEFRFAPERSWTRLVVVSWVFLTLWCVALVVTRTLRWRGVLAAARRVAQPLKRGARIQ